MSTSRDGAAGSGWARLLVVLAARAYRAMLLTLAAIAAAPLVAGWGSYVVSSDSMRPSVAVGDVVLARPTTRGHDVRVGRVYVFDDPQRPERLLVHRVVERRDDGAFTTAGDANDVTDLAPLEAEGIRAQAILLVPHVGLPVHWARNGEWARLAAWLLLSTAAFAIAATRLDGERSLRRRHRQVAVATAVAVAVGAGSSGAAGATFTARTLAPGSTWTVGSWVQPYVGAVITDSPFGLWLLDEPGGTAYAQDRSGNGRTGEYYGSLTLGTPGGLPHNPGTAVDTSGGRVVLGPQPVVAPSAYSIELWFRTTSTSTGYLAGFEDDRDDNWRGATADRIVTLTPSGRITFGAWKNGDLAISTPSSYNDGAWHHLVVTSTSSRFSTVYVDGARVVSGTTSFVDSQTGFWRVGQGSTGNQNGFSSSFTGDLDNVAIYHSVLPAARVAAHWAAR